MIQGVRTTRRENHGELLGAIPLLNGEPWGEPRRIGLVITPALVVNFFLGGKAFCLIICRNSAAALVLLDSLHCPVSHSGEGFIFVDKV